MKLDMHCHTIASDGVNTAQELIADAKKKGLKALFITDHDRVSQEHIPEIQAAGLVTTPSVEITTRDERVLRDVHMTYYAGEFSDELLGILDNTRSKKREEIEAQILHLQDKGFYIDMDEFYSFCRWEGISYYNIAQYIASKDENREKLEQLGCFEEGKKPQSIFYNTCLKKGGELYATYGVNHHIPYKPKLTDVVEMTKGKGVLAFAHPNFTFSTHHITGFLELYRSVYGPYMGISAVEINTRASKKWIEAILAFRDEYPEMQLTFGSDCHRLGKPDDKHGDLGFENRYIDEETVRREFGNFRESLGI